MSFSLYVIGFLIAIGGVAWGGIKAGLPTVWVIIACIVLAGLGMMAAVNHTRQRDVSKTP